MFDSDSDSDSDISLDSSYQQQLMQGAYYGSMDNVYSRLDNFVDINSKDNAGRTALMLACYEGHLTVCQLLIYEGANLNIMDELSLTALFAAAASKKEGCLAMCQLLIDKGAKIDIGSCHVISIAAEDGNLVLCQLLIDKGAKLNHKDWAGQTSLMRAVQNHQIEVSRLLIQKGGDVNIKDNDGMTALMQTALGDGWGGDNLEMCQMLVDEGADLNITNNIGRTALMVALIHGNGCSFRVCRFLSEKGTDLDIEDDHDYIACDLANSGFIRNFLRNYTLILKSKELEKALAVAKEELASVVTSDSVCMFCMDAPKIYAFLPCGHKTYCILCHADQRVRALKMCPYCNIPITGTLRVFE